MNTHLKLIFLLIASIQLSCNLPKDPANTLNKVKNGNLRVGYSESFPWIYLNNNQPAGIEAEIVNRLAEELNAKIMWTKDTEYDLINLLKDRKIDLVAAGLSDDSPWKSVVGFTRPYYTSEKGERYVFAVSAGENAWLVYIEKFLSSNEKKIYNLIESSK